MFWKNRKTEEANTKEGGNDEGFWEYVEKASDEVSDWSNWKKEGWNLVGDSDSTIHNYSLVNSEKDSLE